MSLAKKKLRPLPLVLRILPKKSVFSALYSSAKQSQSGKIKRKNKF
jgi:hypothetical protein